MIKLFKGINVILLVSILVAGASSLGNATSVSAASLPPTLQFTPVVSGLNQPVFVTNAGDGSNRLFIVQQTGQIRIFKNGGLISTPFLNILGLVSNFTGTNGEQGLLSLAFDPNYSTNGFFYITYTTSNNDPTFIYTTTLARYHVSGGNPDLADTASGMVLLSIPKKFTNHNGGMLAFGPDGFLYMSMGDGGSGGDPDGNGQNLNSLLGKLLRLDVDSTPPMGKTYVIPSSNPFFNSSDPNVRKEIWAYGLRNPWRLSFDRSTGDLYIGDVGQDREEEVDFQPSTSSGGENYGWHIKEGNLCYNPSSNCTNPASYVPPVVTYDHGPSDSVGCAVTGGYVYRGSAFPGLNGVYFYGDYCSGNIWALIRNLNGTWTQSLIINTNFTISTFGQDEQGELYAADYGAGNVYRLSCTFNINTSMGGMSEGNVDPCQIPIARQSYSGINNGLVKVMSNMASPIIASERVAYTPDGGTSWTNFSEMMGLPSSLATNTYLFPWYNNVDFNTQLRFANVGSAGTTVTVRLAGMIQASYPVSPNQTMMVRYNGMNTGPVQVQSSGGVPIVASERVAYTPDSGTTWTGFSELMGLPATQMTDTYLFPWYNNADLNTQLRFGNVGGSATMVTVTVAGMFQGTYSLAPNETMRVSFPGLNNGPVQVQSSGGMPIIASERVAYTPDGGTTWPSYSEMMGMPRPQLTNTYLMPWYNNVDLNTQLRFANEGSTNTMVTVSIGGVIKGSYILMAGQSLRVSYAGVNAGPVWVQGTSGIPIIASERVAYTPDSGVTWTSFSEMAGLPSTQLANSYLFPWYNNADFNTQLRFGIP